MSMNVQKIPYFENEVSELLIFHLHANQQSTRPHSSLHKAREDSGNVPEKIQRVTFIRVHICIFSTQKQNMLLSEA